MRSFRRRVSAFTVGGAAGLRDRYWLCLIAVSRYSSAVRRAHRRHLSPGRGKLVLGPAFYCYPPRPGLVKLALNSTTRAVPDQTRPRPKSADFVGDPGPVGSGRARVVEFSYMLTFVHNTRGVI